MLGLLEDKRWLLGARLRIWGSCEQSERLGGSLLLCNRLLLLLERIDHWVLVKLKASLMF